MPVESDQNDDDDGVNRGRAKEPSKSPMHAILTSLKWVLFINVPSIIIFISLETGAYDPASFDALFGAITVISILGIASVLVLLLGVVVAVTRACRRLNLQPGSQASKWARPGRVISVIVALAIFLMVRIPDQAKLDACRAEAVQTKNSCIDRVGATSHNFSERFWESAACSGE